MRLLVKLGLAGLALVGVLGVLAGCGRTPGPAAAQAATVSGSGYASASAVSSQTGVGTKAPDFTGVDVMTGQTVTLSQFRGKPVLLNFVNYGCSTSLNNLVSAQLLAIRQVYPQRSDFVPVSIFCGCCPAAALRQFATNNNLNWPWVLDSANSIIPAYSEYLWQFGYPTLVFVDNEGTVREVTGAVSQIDLGSKLDALVGVAGTPGRLQ